MIGRPVGDRVRRTLTDLVDFAAEVARYVTDPGQDNFLVDRQTQLAAEALLHRIGEAVSRLPEGFVAEHPEVSWRPMKGMRNVVAHEYGYVDYRIVWRALARDLPRDIDAIKQILGAS